jgi:hypothetical protein
VVSEGAQPPPADGPAARPDDVALERWLGEVRADDAARARARVGALVAHAAEDATLVGVLADLAERAAPVVLGTTSGRRHRGRVLLVGPDAAVLQVDAHEWTVVRLAAVASVRTVGGDPVHGEGSASTASRFGRLVGAAVAPGDRLRAAVGPDAVSGTVVAVSAEVVVLRFDGGDVSYVHLAAVDEVSLHPVAG